MQGAEAFPVLHPGTSSACSGRLVGLALAGACGAFLALVSGSALLDLSPELRAAPAVEDADGDGLNAALEDIMGTNPNAADTDGDGLSDSEEIARKSSPLDPASLPGSEAVQVGMVAYSEDGPVHAFTAIYVQDRTFDDKTFAMGVRAKNSLVYLPTPVWLGGAIVSIVPAAQGGQVMLIDPQFAANHVHRFGSLTFFTTVSVNNTVVAAAATNVQSKGGLIVEYTFELTHGGPPGSVMAFGQGGTGLYRPIGGNDVPPDWTPGEVCSQTVVVTGVQGAVVTQEVVDASCQDGWDGYCDPNCSLTVGDTIKVVDPGALIGG